MVAAAMAALGPRQILTHRAPLTAATRWVRDFARASMNYALQRNFPLYLSTKNTILKVYDGRFKDLFQEVFDAEFKDKFASKGLTYEHRQRTPRPQ